MLKINQPQKKGEAGKQITYGSSEGKADKDSITVILMEKESVKMPRNLMLPDSP